MAEYIERSAIMRRIEIEAFRWGEEYDLQQILGDIEDAPAADVVEVRHGEWDWYPNKLDRQELLCTICEQPAPCNDDGKRIRAPYCPNCGAKMDGATDTSVGGKMDGKGEG